MADIPLIPGRECGTCTACCSVLTIDHPEIQKYSGILCKNCDGKGCRIYATRPTPCRTFYCAWRIWPEFNPLARPDRTGVLPLIEFARDEPASHRPDITLVLYGNDRNAIIRAPWFIAFVQQAILRDVDLYLGLAAPPECLPLRASLRIDGMIVAARTSPQAVGKVLEQALRFLETQPFRPYALQNSGNDVG